MLKNPYYILAVLYGVFIFWLSAQSDPPDPTWDFPGKDKIAHMVLYGVLAGLVSLGLRRSETPVSTRRQYVLPVLIVAVYGLSDEIHQLFVPRRHFDVLDLAANILGAILTQTVLCKVWWRLPWTDASSEEKR